MTEEEISDQVEHDLVVIQELASRLQDTIVAYCRENGSQRADIVANALGMTISVGLACVPNQSYRSDIIAIVIAGLQANGDLASIVETLQ
jgi:hypothetical protein